MVTRIKHLFLIAAAVALIATGCVKPAPSTSVMDTPEYHYKNGLKYLDKDQIDDAMKSFDRAIALDPKSPLGYIGKGWPSARRATSRPPSTTWTRAKAMTGASRPASA